VRIPLKFDGDRENIYINAGIVIPGKPGPFPVSFIVDTGSPVTFIDEFYSSKFRVFAKNLPLGSPIYMGGTKVDLYKLSAVEMIFRDEKDKPIAINFEDMSVAKTAWTRKEARYVGESILGMNFLKNTKSSLFVDPSNALAYMEK